MIFQCHVSFQGCKFNLIDEVSWWQGYSAPRFFHGRHTATRSSKRKTSPGRSVPLYFLWLYIYMGVEPKIGGFFPPKMDGENFMENHPMNKWMIWGAHPYFWKHPYIYIDNYTIKKSVDLFSFFFFLGGGGGVWKVNNFSHPDALLHDWKSLGELWCWADVAGQVKKRRDEREVERQLLEQQRLEHDKAEGQLDFWNICRESFFVGKVRKIWCLFF